MESTTPTTDVDEATSDPTLMGAVEAAVDAAVRARARSYSPYSSFKMGAGLIGFDGEQVLGTLIENVSLGLAMCSERVALFSAITQQIRPRVLALCSPRTEADFTFPCGACLQVALELAGPDLVVVAVDTDGQRAQTRLIDLLPRAPRRFSPHDSQD